MRPFLLFAAAFLLTAAPAARGQRQLAFQPPTDGYSTFDTGLLRGKMQLDGKSQGIASLVYAPTGMELAKAPGLLSYYRVLVSGAVRACRPRLARRRRGSSRRRPRTVFSTGQGSPLGAYRHLPLGVARQLGSGNHRQAAGGDAAHGNVSFLVHGGRLRGSGLPAAQPAGTGEAGAVSPGRLVPLV